LNAVDEEAISATYLRRRRRYLPARRKSVIRRTKFTTGAAVALATATAVLLTACGSGGGDSGGKGASGASGGGNAPKTVTFGLLPAISALPFEVAYQQGYFDDTSKKYGVKVKTTYFDSGPQLTSSMVGKSTQFLIIGPLTLIAAANKGTLDPLITSQVDGPGGVVLVGAKKYQSSRGSDLSQYKGGNWAFTSVGSTTQITMKALSQKAGLNWDSDVKGLPLGADSAMIPAMRAGRIDIASLSPNGAAEAVNLGIGYVVANAMDPSVGKPAWGNAVGTAVATTKGFADKYPAFTRDLTADINRAFEYVKTNADDPEKVYAAASPKFRSAISKEDFVVAWQYAKLSYTGYDTQIGDTSVADTIKLAQVGGILGPSDDLAKIKAIFAVK
jgi:ABC-type nitrate/sulfonate/bicarbonate transport system substrate-binding protein